MGGSILLKPGLCAKSLLIEATWFGRTMLIFMGNRQPAKSSYYLQFIQNKLLNQLGIIAVLCAAVQVGRDESMPITWFVITCNLLPCE